jgi:hypothetical protein
MNQVNVIFAYKIHNQWMFDDETKGLKREAFVAGADTILESQAKGADTITLLFSDGPFPDAHKFTRGAHDGTGDWYSSRSLKSRGWLCPALLKYFDTAPKELYVQFRRTDK